MTTPLEPWQWPEAHWRGIVDRVRAGRTLRPRLWPEGARCAVALSFDSDHETNELRDGGESPGKLSQGQYGNRQGVPRILDDDGLKMLREANNDGYQWRMGGYFQPATEAPGYNLVGTW